MTPDTFMDIVTLVRNRLEKKHTRFREAAPIEKEQRLLYGVQRLGTPTAALQNICYWKIDSGKHYRLSKYFIEFPRTPTGTARAIATFKETTNCKIPQVVGAI